ncbi:MAG: DUF2807 domain-containing protein [Gammaproteobacteria bacterium]|nr:DUF2807 domain-containing protein [Gammaproteobacteria bacterium]
MARWLSSLWLTVFLAAGSSFAFAGDGIGTTEDREFTVSAFDRVFISGGATVELLQGNEVHVSASGSRKVLDGLRVESGGGSLFIDTDDHGAQDLVIRLTFESLQEMVFDGQVVITSDSLKVEDLIIEGNGSSSIELHGLIADELQVSGLGATKFSLSGTVQRQVINIDGSGAYRAEGLSSRTVEVSVSGVGDVLLSVKEMLDVEIAGAARVRYTGSPFVTQRVFGVGSVHRIDHVQI